MDSSFSSLPSLSSNTSMGEAARAREEALREEIRLFYQQTGYFIHKETFNQCFGTIKPWINMSVLIGYLMKHGLVNDADDMGKVQSNFLDGATKLRNLFVLTESNGGKNGYFVLYKCLCESREENPLAHGDVVDELERYAAAHPVIPEWLEQGGETGLTSSSSGVSLPSSVSSQWTVGTDDTGGQSSIPRSQSSDSGSQSSNSIAQNSTSPDTQSSSLTSSQVFRPQAPQPTRSQAQATQPTRSQAPQSTHSQAPQPTRSQLPQPTQAQASQPTRSQGPQPTRSQASPFSYVSQLSGQGQSHGATVPKSTVTKEYLRPLDKHYNLSSDPTRLDKGASSQKKAGAVGPASNVFKSMASDFSTGSYRGGDSGNFPRGQSETSGTFIDVSPHQYPGAEGDRSRFQGFYAERDVGGEGQDGAETERDTGGDSQGGAEAPETLSSQYIRTASTLISSGDVHTLCTKYEGTMDVDCVPPELCEKKDNFMDEVCKFVCGVLNSRKRDSDRIGVLLGGVSYRDDDKSYQATGFALQSAICDTILRRFSNLLRTTIVYKDSQKDDLEALDTKDLSRMVRIEFVSVKSSEDQAEKTIAVVYVSPLWDVCKGYVFHCRFVDGAWPRKKLQCFTRVEGQTVDVKPHKISPLENKLNNLFIQPR